MSEEDGDENPTGLSMGFYQEFQILTYSVFTLAVLIGLWLMTKIVYMVYKVGRRRRQSPPFQYWSDRDSTSRGSDDSRTVRFGTYSVEEQRLRHSQPDSKGASTLMIVEPEQFPEPSSGINSPRRDAISPRPVPPPPPPPLREDSVTL